VEKILKDHVLISVHEHLGVFPKDIMQTPAYIKEGRMATGFNGLAKGHWDCVFDNLMNGVCQIHSKGGWKWSEVTHDLGMRLCDIAHQDFVIHCKTVADIYRIRFIVWIWFAFYRDYLQRIQCIRFWIERN